MMRGSGLSREDKMRAIASLIAAVGMLCAGALVAAAMPADGAAIARVAQQVDAVVVVKKGKKSKTKRSEEHTSELQSPDHLVCRLLLEKKQPKHIYIVETVASHWRR